MKIVIDGIVESIKSRQDGSVTVAFGTQELDGNKAGDLFQLRGKYCKAMFSDTNITSLEEEVVDKTPLTATQKNKSPSQRLRSVLHVYFSQQGYSIDFDDFYKTELEKIISHYKTKLE